MSYKPVDTAITMIVGPLIDDTDFKSLEESTAYNAAGMDVSLIVEKTDGTTATTAITLTSGGTSDWTHKDGGYYEVEVTAAQNAEEGIAYVRGICTGVLPFESTHYNIVKANIYDSWVKGTDKLQTDATQLAGVTQSLTDLKDFADAGYDPSTNKVQGVVLTDTTTTNTDMVGTDNAALAATALTDVTWTDARAAALTDWINGGRLDLILDIIAADTTTDIPGLIATAQADLDTITGADGVTLATAQALYAPNVVIPDVAGVAATPAEVATALTDIHLDHLLAANYDPASKPGVATALLNELVENDGGVSRYTANALEQAPSGGTNPNVLIDTTLATVTDQTHVILTAGSNDDDAYKDQSVVVYDASDSDYPSVRKCSGYAGATKTVTLDSAPDFTMISGDGCKVFVTAPGTTAPTAAQVADAVLDELVTDHTVANSLSKAVSDTLADTNELQGDWLNGGRLDLILDIIAADTTTDIPAILNHADYGLAQLLRSTTPANTLDVAASGEASADAIKISGDATAANNMELQYDTTGLAGDTFPATQAQVGNISSGTAATNTTAGSATVTTGSETNTYTSTAALDGTLHIVEDSGNVTDFYYEFDVGANGVPVGVAWEGYAQGQGDTYNIFAWNWTGTPAWEQIGSKAGVNGTTIVAEAYALSTAHVGTGVDVGTVRIRIQSTDGAAFGTDRLLCSFATVYRSAGYSDGAIWVDTNNGSAGTTDYVNGTADNPCLTWAAAKTLSTSLGIKKFNIVNGSDVTMDASCDNFTFVGFDYSLALGGQSFENAHIGEAHVSGIGTAGSGTIHFHTCNISAASLGKAHFHNCGFDGDVVATAAATYIFDACFNSADGSTPPSFDFGGAVGNTHVGGRNWHGGVEIRNLGALGTDVFSITGAGAVVIASTCSGGTIKVVGSFTITDNVVAGFAGTLTEDARYDVDQINDEVAAALATYDPPTRTEATTDKDDIITEVNANETKIDTVDANVDSILADTGTDGVVVASGSKTGYALSSAGVDSIHDEVMEGTLTHRQIQRILLAALAGKSTGGGTVTLTFRDNADGKARITATVDANGNRTAITKDGT